MEPKSSTKRPQPLSELLPELKSILSKDSIQSLTAKKQPISRKVTGTVEKLKPLTEAELRANISCLRVQSPKRVVGTSKKKTWNSSVKVDKTVSRTAGGQSKFNPVKKVLNFQPKSNPMLHSRATMAVEPPTFHKPEMRVRKKLFTQVNSNVRVSGISCISATPVINMQVKKRMTVENKENINKQSIKKTLPPKMIFQKRYNVSPGLPNTPLSHESSKFSCDMSFLQREKEINDVEEKNIALSEERTLENISEVTPPVSTPFTNYRNIKDYFDGTPDIDKSAVCHDNTFMYFDQPPPPLQENTREDSVIVSLSDLINKVTLRNDSSENITELKDLELIEKRTEHNMQMIENSISVLNKIRDSQLSSLTSVRRLIKEKRAYANGLNKTLTNKAKDAKEPKFITKEIATVLCQQDIKPYSETVIQPRTNSPTYRIPKKNVSLRKKICRKSISNVASNDVTPMKIEMGDQALNMYMKMKDQMNFLSTPAASQQHLNVQRTSALTSRNLQKQLDKLYGEN